MNKHMSARGGSASGGKKLLYIVPVIALLAAGCGSAPKPDQQTQQASDQNQQGNSSNTGQQGAGSALIEQPSYTWTGTLKMSDNAKKGSLMLVTGDHTVYINTSRDFSALVGKKVNVAYQGTLDSFTLGDISAAK